MPDYRAKEHLSLYRGGFAYAATREGGHITGDYEILGDTTEEGVRTIVLKEKDTAPHLERVKKLTRVILERLGETRSRVLRELLEDTLRDYKPEDVERVLNKIVEKKEPVKTKEGCYRIIIGDGRRKNCEVLHIGERT